MHDPSKPAESLFPMEACPKVPDEAFNLFHSIDRELFTRLIQNLGRNSLESVHVMAFWMWLERESSNHMLIKGLLSLPPTLLNELANETVSCLKCVENDVFHIRDGNEKEFEITLLPKLLGNPAIGLRFFHENRVAVFQGVNKVVNTVCARAFNDILQKSARAYTPDNIAGEGNSSGGASGAAAYPYPTYFNAPLVPLAGGVLVQFLSPPQGQQLPIVVAGAQFPPTPEALEMPMHMVSAEASFPDYKPEVQPQVVSNDVGETVGKTPTAESSNNRRYGAVEVPPDDRTIFLTFSKGYPITEDEVREFFTRKFGNFIDEIIMQEVGTGEQVLYARMVSRSVGVVDEIVRGNKAKYAINGKHVWARKYVKKQHQQQLKSHRMEGSSSA